MSTSTQITPDEALAAILAGRTVRVVVGSDPEDPICLHYIDRCYEHDYEPMIYSEAVAGWSEGVKEAVCDPAREADRSFYVGWVAEPSPLSIEITDEVPIGREAGRP